MNIQHLHPGHCKLLERAGYANTGLASLHSGGSDGWIMSSGASLDYIGYIARVYTSQSVKRLLDQLIVGITEAEASEHCFHCSFLAPLLAPSFLILHQNKQGSGNSFPTLTLLQCQYILLLPFTCSVLVTRSLKSAFPAKMTLRHLWPVRGS